MQDFALNRRFWNAVLFKARANLYIDAARTYLNIAWWVLEPLLFMVLYYVIFGLLLNLREEHFVVFLLIGLVSWQWLEKSVAASTGSIAEGRLILRKIPINRMFFPLAIVFSDLTKTALVFSVLLASLLMAGYGIGIRWPALVLVIAVQFLLVVSLCLWAALLTPFFPDLRILVNVMLRALMFASGIFYSPSLVPEEIRGYFFWNPVALVVDEYRKALLRDQSADLAGLLTIAGICVLLIVAAGWFSRRFGDRYLRRVL